MQPGEIIGPGGQPPQEPKEVPEQNTPQEAQPVAVEAPAPQQSEEQAVVWQFRQDDDGSDVGVQSNSLASHEVVSWTASEYIAHEKSGSWYLVLSVTALGFAAAVWLLTRELVSPIVILVMGLAFGTFAARKPQELTYELTNSALRVGERTYPYSLFKSFTIVEEGAIHSILLMPLQRFMPPLSIYYDPVDEEKIAEALQSYLPYEDRRQDVVDRFMRKIRF